MTDPKIQSNPTTLEPSLDELLKYEATPMTRVVVSCADTVKMGDLVTYAGVDNCQFVALRDAKNGKTVINPVNCVINVNALSEETRKALAQYQKTALMFGILYQGLPEQIKELNIDLESES